MKVIGCDNNACAKKDDCVKGRATNATEIIRYTPMQFHNGSKKIWDCTGYEKYWGKKCEKIKAP